MALTVRLSYNASSLWNACHRMMTRTSLRTPDPLRLLIDHTVVLFGSRGGVRSILIVRRADRRIKRQRKPEVRNDDQLRRCSRRIKRGKEELPICFQTDAAPPTRLIKSVVIS